MDNSLLDIVNQIKDKCVENDCDVCEKFGLSPAEYDFFKSTLGLSRIDTSIVAERMSISQSRLSRVVDKLVKNGFLDRKTSTKDRRAIKLSLTSKGRSMRKRIENYKSECERRIEKNLTEEEIVFIKSKLQDLIKRL